MKERLFVLGLCLLFAAGLTSCGDKLDPDEQREAENLVNGLNMMTMMTNVDAYSALSFAEAPPYWEGPDTFAVPAEWANDIFYRWIFMKFPVDSMGTAIDSAYLYLMFTPDVWDSLFIDSIPWQMDIGILAEVRDIWFHTVVAIPDTAHVTGQLRWNWDETWYDYSFDVSQLDEAADIDITTSTNIGLSAYFLFDGEGYGSEEDNYAQWHNTVFVRFEFFADPDANGYDGYYTLLSEAWKVRHYFTLVDYGAAF